MNNFYLEEKSLGNFLSERFRLPVTSPRKKLLEGIFLPDFVIEDLKLILEYDGPRHYTQSSTAVRDEYKKIIYQQYGYNLISIPYYVQLDDIIIRQLFKNYINEMSSVETYNDYPHGFISDKVILPADFCSLGVHRFRQELDGIFCCIKEQILDSLNNKVTKKRTRAEVFPLEM